MTSCIENPTLTKREYIAALALTSLGNGTMGWVKDKADIDQVATARAEMAVLLADALLKALGEPPYQLIETAIDIIETERDVLHDSHSIDGQFRVVDSVDVRAHDHIVEMDNWLREARAVIASKPGAWISD